MNQENAPHMQPMEQAGEQGSVPYPSYNEERPATEAGSAKHSARPDIHSSLRVRTRAIPSLSCSGYPNAALSRAWPYGMPYGGYPQPGYTVPAHNLPPTVQTANVNGQPSQGQPFSANMANNPEPQVAAQGFPGYPIGYQQPQTGYPQQAFQQFAAAANPHVMQPAVAQPYPQTPQQPASDAYQAGSLSCPPLWNQQRMAKITPTQ